MIAAEFAPALILSLTARNAFFADFAFEWGERGGNDAKNAIHVFSESIGTAVEEAAIIEDLKFTPYAGTESCSGSVTATATATDRTIFLFSNIRLEHV